ncbi:tumor necrosis factor receptor superfamily member 4-like [Carassius auratus]|uniref:Tumor necrosis factor receptor superfamily member 4-like n=1 Tax=Carassius auratus TaxID=7957 RepID=A0A6P6LJN8_CARAU|nr:tumor necrosis factor receptor superfamily member 4-like [Carassius auratus]
MSKKMLALLSVLLLSSHVLPLVQSLQCDERTEYLDGNRCCKKCKPGELMMKKCEGKTETVCEPCGNGYFTDDYNINYQWCKHCTTCTRENMKYMKDCTVTSDANCTCEDGYRCSDSKCESCEKIQTTTVTTPPSTKTISPTHDNVWISVSLCFACVCVCALLTCFLLISRHARPCGRIMSTSIGLCSSDKSSLGSSQCTEEEEVPMPVQEVCGKTEKLEDV